MDFFSYAWVIFFVVIILGFIINKVKKSYNEQNISNDTGIPNNATVFLDNNFGVNVMSGKEINDFVNNFQNSIGTLIVNHFEGMKKAMNESISNAPLDRVINMKDEIKEIIIKKMQLVLKDGESHSMAVTDLDKTVLINVTCIKCKLSELKEKYEREIGPYLYLLQRYISMAEQNGLKSFVHIIYCYSDNGGGITATYMNLSTKLFIKPNELISDEEMNIYGM